MKFKCDALRDFVPFLQFKKCEKQPWRSVNFSKVNDQPNIYHIAFISRWSLCAPKFEIQDAERNPVLLIEGPICTCRCGDVEFKVINSCGR